MTKTAEALETLELGHPHRERFQIVLA